MKLDQYEEKLKEMETKLEDVKEMIYGRSEECQVKGIAAWVKTR